MAYRLTLPPGSRLHPFFHVSLLKEFHGPSPESSPPIPDITLTDDPIPTRIVDRRPASTADDVQILVEWHGRSRDDASWESWKTLTELFP